MIPGPQHVERAMNWKKETELRRSSWPFVAYRCKATIGTEHGELCCEHLVGHPHDHYSHASRTPYQWTADA